jgi:hypothetical protein
MDWYTINFLSAEERTKSRLVSAGDIVTPKPGESDAYSTKA